MIVDGLPLQFKMLLSYYIDKVFERYMQLWMPTAYLSELLDTEVKKLCFQLGLKQILNIIVFTAKQVIKFKP